MVRISYRRFLQNDLIRTTAIQKYDGKMKRIGILLISILIVSTILLESVKTINCIVKLPPGPVTIVLYYGNDSYFDATLSNVPAGCDVTNRKYLGWCIDPSADVYPGLSYQALLYSSCDPPPHLQRDYWDMINYILNHKQGTVRDIQRAIWYFTNGYAPTRIGQEIVDDALMNGEGFIPIPSQVVAVICDPVESGRQRVIIETHMSEYGPPRAHFSENPENPCVGETVTFNASLSRGGYDGDNSTRITEYRWDFNGDGTIDRIKNDPITTYTYTKKGKYNVTLTVFAPGIPPTIHSGYVNTDTMWHIKTVVECKSPKAFFTENPESPLVNELVSFNASLSAKGFDGFNNCSIIWYYWNFGDSNTANKTNSNTTHVYNVAGSYNVTLKVYAPSTRSGITCYNPFDMSWHIKTVVSSRLVHDIAIMNVTPSQTKVYPARMVNITVVVRNKGEAAETFNVTVYRDSIPIGTKLVPNLDVGENTTLIFQWSTSGLIPCHTWVIRAEAPLVGDIHPSDNTFTDGTVKIALLGDVNADGIVNLSDLIEAAKAFGAIPGSPIWNPQADIWPDGVINILDLKKIAVRFGQHC